MIAPYALSKWMAKHLSARGFQLEVEYEPRYAHPPRRNVVVIKRDRTALEPIEVVSGAKGARFAKRFLPCLGLVYCVSPLSGAHHGDHETLAYQVVDAFYVGLLQWVTEANTDVRFTGSRLLGADELNLGQPGPAAGDNVWPGVVHQTQFAVGHGVFDRNADGTPFGRFAKVASVRTTSTIESQQGEPEQAPALPSDQE